MVTRSSTRFVSWRPYYRTPMSVGASMSKLAEVKGVRPLFPFYGSKWRDAVRYPKPRSIVVEPFAGSATYSLRHGVDRAVLVERDPIIAGLWRYLIKVTSSEILGLPDLEPGQLVDDLANVPQEAKWLIGFWLNRGSATPKKRATKFSSRTDKAQLVWGERARERIAASVHLVRNWVVIEGDYSSAPRLGSATYFIDPPYVDKGRYYRFSEVDYKHLAEWCRGLPGYRIVCEQHGADWLPFQPLATIKSRKGVSREVVWTAGAC